VPGDTLKKLIAGRPVNPRRAIDLTVQIADALADAHAEGIVHRDIKPDNIIVTPKGNAKILDFGLATWTTGGAEREQAATMMETSVGTTLGTVAYMSPEQALGERVDQRTDIFSLGIVLFEMLTGKLPFSGVTSTALALRLVQAAAPAPSSINRSLPIEFDPIVARALSKSLDQRYETAATFAAELRSLGAILDERSDSEEMAAAFAPAPKVRRRGIAGWIVPVLVLGAIAAGSWYERGPIQRLWKRWLGPPPAAVIAIMPFESDPAQAFFGDGLAEDLTTRIGQLPGLKVVGRSAARSYRGRQPRIAARELGAAAVLTGSVRPAGDTVTLSLQLIDPSDDTAVWSGQYTRDVKDVFAMQVQVAADIAKALRVTAAPTPATARAASRLVDPRAYEFYLRGRQALADRRLPYAVALFERAVAADAGLGEAFASLAEAQRLQGGTGGPPDDVARRERVQAAAKRAYEVDPDLPAANVAMALTSDPLAETLKYLHHAIEIDPSYAEAYRLVGDALQDFDPPQAIAFFRKSLALDPMLDASRAAMATALGVLGRDEEAQNALKAMSRPGADPALTARRQALAEIHSGRDAPAAAAVAERAPDSCEARTILAALAVDRKETAAAHKSIDGLIGQGRQDSASTSEVRCALLGAAALRNGPQAVAMLDRVTADEPRLRAFATVVNGRSGTMWIDPRIYPWSLIERQPAVEEARARLDAAYTRARETAAAELKGLP
jgi:non-specific serine/threonine protein kinase